MKTGVALAWSGYGMNLLILIFGMPVSLAANQPCVNTQNRGINITLAQDVAETRKARELLMKLVRDTDLRPYLFTRNIRIQKGARPHSFPILTLNADYNDNPPEFISAFLHEEIHRFWYEHQNSLNAEAEFRKLYPRLPRNPADVADDEDATYRHLGVCWLELQADKKYLGPRRAYALLRASDGYRWIYRTVVNDEAKIGEIIEKYNLLII
ncbi:MAG: hypothetical protein HY074_09850 [Deltaproteobacteria bacterium]|nr:hypothetical protein [Deltaproteobacteria bacterium]